jgi:hypothetical protein
MSRVTAAEGCRRERRRRSARLRGRGREQGRRAVARRHRVGASSGGCGIAECGVAAVARRRRAASAATAAVTSRPLASGPPQR